MLLTLKDNKDNIVIKDILDINFNMKVENKKDGEFFVKVNSKYKLAEEFSSKDEAESQMINLASARNTLEQELRDF